MSVALLSQKKLKIHITLVLSDMTKLQNNEGGLIAPRISRSPCSSYDRGLSKMI
jgi:hypothetical protein